MKRLLSFILCASLLFGCNTTPDPVLTVTPENLAFSAEGGAQTVQVKANNPWTASASGSGISVNPSSGDGDATVTVTATATSSTNPVSGTVVFRSEGLSATVSVTQDERKVIQVGDVMTIPAEGGTFAVDIKYNTEYTVEVEASAKSWISFLGTRALQSGKLEFQFAENQNTEPRTGKVTVRDNSGKAAPVTLNFVQEEKKVITVGDVMTIPAEGGTFAVDIQYNTDLDVVVESGAQSWITFVATRALKSGKLEFRFAENQNTDPRQGKVTVKDKSGKVSDITLTFVQEEKKVIAVGDVMTIPAEGGTFSVDVQYNTDFDVVVESGAQSWITFVATRALQSGKLEFRFAENQSTDPRQGKVTVKDKSGKVSDITLSFVQEEKKVITVGDVMEIPAEGGTFSVDVLYNTDVVVEVESAAQSWIHFVAVRALTSGKLEFSFDANPNPDVRSGKVTVKDKNGKVAPITLTFVQAEKKVIQVGDVMEIPAEGGTFEVDVQYNTDVVVKVESAAQSWIHFVAVRALTSGKLEFSFDANPNPDVRSGKVTVKDKNGKVAPITLTFVQAEKKVIQVGDVTEIPAEGGTFEVDVQYNTDVVVEVESAAQSWIHFVAVRALTSGKLEFSFDANPNPDARTGKVTVKDKNGKVAPITLTFVQAEKKVIAVGDVMEIPAEGGTFAVDVHYNTDVVVEVESAAQSWIHFVAVRALTSGKLEFSFDANPNPDARTGEVTVKDKNGKVSPITLTFVQAEKKVIQVGDVMEIPAEGGTFEVDVQYNTDVVVEVESAAQSWIHFVAVRALTSGKLEFQFSENMGIDPRRGIVYIKDKTSLVTPITLSFTQDPRSVFSLSEDSIIISGEEGDFSVSVESNLDYSVIIKEGGEWLSLNETRTLETKKHTFHALANNSIEERTAHIEFSAKSGAFKAQVSVTQKVRTIPNNEIWYTSIDGEPVYPDPQVNFGVNLVSCSFENGRGRYVFDGDVISIPQIYAWGMRFKTLVLPNSVTSIGKYTFARCGSLESVTLPDSLLFIDDYAFSQCYSLKSISLPESTVWIGSCVFINCSSLETVKLPRNLSSIPDFAFGYCSSLKVVTGCDNVQSIGGQAFYRCYNLCELPHFTSVESISYSAFSECKSLSSIILSDKLRSIGDGVFGECSQLESVELGENVTEIPGGAFYKCASLKRFSFGSHLVSIGNTAFSGCEKLESVELPATLTTIGKSAFGYCSNLKRVVIKGPLSNLEERIFELCTGLEEVELAEGTTYITTNMFSSCSNLKKVNIPNSVTRINNSAFYRCSSLTEITIPNAVTTFGTSIFTGCSRLQFIKGKGASSDNRCLVNNNTLIGFAPYGVSKYELPNNITTISTGVFLGANELEELTIGNNCTRIDGYAFAECPRLNKVLLPDSVTKIGQGIFSKCTAIEEIDFPINLREIPGGVCEGCSNLKTANIGSMVSSIGPSAFQDCTQLLSIYCRPTSPPTLGNGAFANVNSNLKIFVPSSSLSTYQSNNGWRVLIAYLKGYDY